MLRSAVRRGALVTALTTGALVLLGGTALAHVTVNPDEETQGGYAKLAFRVPNESDTASTVKVAVRFPADAPLASVRVRPHEGWKADLTRSKLPKPVEVGDYTLDEAVTAVTWTAEKGVRIGPGEFDEFEVSVGPLPKESAMAFTAVQTYDDGEVVRWDEPSKEGAEEPEHPAPVLSLVPETRAEAASARQTAERSGASGADASDDSTGGTPAAGTSDPTARALGAAGLGLGVVGLGFAVATFVAVRRRDTP